MKIFFMWSTKKDYLFAPENMYLKNHLTFVNLEDFEQTSEGISRPGHFRGVATIVTKLFNIVQPTNAYFGQKDAAQCVLIRRIVQDLDMDLSIKIMDIWREADGLAMSSRNMYLTEKERNTASIIYQSLCAARKFHMDTITLARGELKLDARDIKEVVTNVLNSEPMVTNVQYVSVDSKDTMKKLLEVGTDGAIISIACTIGRVRLIDNIVL